MKWWPKKRQANCTIKFIKLREMQVLHWRMGCSKGEGLWLEPVVARIQLSVYFSFQTAALQENAS